MEKKLLEYIAQEFVEDDSLELTIDTPLFSRGLIDSFSQVSLVFFIEKTFGKRIPTAQITASSFDTVRQMVEIINHC